MEAGLLAGGALVLAAVVLSVIAFVDWDDSSFRHLNYPDSLRLTIPAAVMLMLGVQTVLSSFFLSVLGIKQTPEPDADRQRRPVHPPPSAERGAVGVNGQTVLIRARRTAREASGPARRMVSQ